MRGLCRLPDALKIDHFWRRKLERQPDTPTPRVWPTMRIVAADLIALRLLSCGRRAQLVYNFFETGHQFQRVQREHKH